MSLTCKQIAYLSCLASNLNPIFEIVERDLSDAFYKSLDTELSRREIVKIYVSPKLFNTAEYYARLITREISANVVEARGTSLVLYRRSEAYMIKI